MFWQRTEDLRKASQMMFESDYSKESIRRVIDPLYEAGTYDHTKLADSITRQLDRDSKSEVAKPFLYEVANLNMYNLAREVWIENGMLTFKGKSGIGLGSIGMIFRWGVPYSCMYAPRSSTQYGVTLFKYLMYRFQLFSNVQWSLRGEAVYVTDTKFDLQEPLEYWQIGLIERWLEEQTGNRVISNAHPQEAAWRSARFVFKANEEHIITPIVNIERVKKNVSRRLGVNIQEIKPLGAY